MILMDFFLLSIRILLAGVFLVAGLTKLVDRAGSYQAMVDFGLPKRLARPFGFALPLAELAIAFLLLFNITTWMGAIGTFSLLLIFIAGITYNLAKGRKPDCHCFGELHSTPIGWSTVVRNGILALLAALIIWQGPGLNPVIVLSSLSAFQWLGIAFAVLVITALVAQGWFIVNLLRQNGRLLVRLEAIEANADPEQPQPSPTPAHKPVLGLPVGSVAPKFSLPQLDGKEVTLDGLRSAGKPVLLIFTDPDCGPCSALMPQVAVWQREHASRLYLVVTSRGAKEKNQTLQREHGLTNLLLQKDREVSLQYQAYGTPSAVLIRLDGTIGSPLAGGADAITTLVASSVKPPQPNQVVPPRRGLQKGDPAPTFTLKDLDGKEMRSKDLRGKSSLLLFWNPGCGFCQRMLGQLKEWEANPLYGAPQLVLISSGSVEDNRVMGLRSPILLDQGFATGHAFGVGGTPSAILIDAKGKIASEVAVGAPGVLALSAARQDREKLATPSNTAIRTNGGA
jgi:methylamine dehydrogenase accessory protein MauD